MAKRNIGSSLDDFLAEEAFTDEVNALAIKRVLAWQIEEAMKKQKITKTELTARTHTGRAALNRLLDEKDANVTLTTLAGVAAALGKKLRVEFVDSRVA
jgi:DNA-binding Xre family transcriptional regulator